MLSTLSLWFSNGSLTKKGNNTGVQVVVTTNIQYILVYQKSEGGRQEVYDFWGEAVEKHCLMLYSQTKGVKRK